MIAAKIYWALLIWQALLTLTFHGSFHVILTTNSWCGYYYHSHFTHEVTEAQNSQVTQSRWPVGERWSEHSNLGSSLAEPVLITSILLKAILKRKWLRKKKWSRKVTLKTSQDDQAPPFLRITEDLFYPFIKEHMKVSIQSWRAAKLIFSTHSTQTEPYGGSWDLATESHPSTYVQFVEQHCVCCAVGSWLSSFPELLLGRVAIHGT